MSTFTQAPSESRLSVALYPPGGNLQPASRCPGRAWRYLPLEGLPNQRTNALQDDDAQPGGVHTPVPVARAARRISPHPPLWAARQMGNVGRIWPRRVSCWVSRGPASTRPFWISMRRTVWFSQPSFVRVAVRRCASSRPSCAASRFAHHFQRGLRHDRPDSLLLHPTVGSSSSSADSGRLCLAVEYHAVLPAARYRIRAIGTGFDHFNEIANPRPPIIATHGARAARQIPIALHSASAASPDLRGFLPWGLCDACPYLYRFAHVITLRQASHNP